MKPGKSYQKTCIQCGNRFIGAGNERYCKTDECRESMKSKLCADCGEEKPIDQFYIQKKDNRPSGKCKSCHYQDAKTWVNNNKELRREINRRYAENGNLKKYGLTREEYNELLEAQNELCAICKKREVKTLNGNLVRLSVDHCHKTEKVRELLCVKCNGILGLANDDIDLLTECIDYLRKHGENE